MLNKLRIACAVLAVGLTAAASVNAQEEKPRQVLFTNVNIFDGVKGELIENGSVLVEGNLIQTVSSKPIVAPGAFKVDGEGRTLMPGLIDMHSHLCIRNGMPEFRTEYDQMAAGAIAAHALLEYLDQGFTTARDAGCNVLGVAKAVNNGDIPGPRIYPAGGFLSQTGGHADTGFFNDRIGDQDDLERHAFGYIVDGVTEARSPDGKLFGTGRMADVLRAECHRQAHEMVDRLIHQVCDFARREAPADDVTVVVMKAL